MADKKPNNRPNREAEDVMHGRNLEGAEYGATEREQTRDRERVARGDHTDEIDEVEVTDAEIEAREEDRSDREG